MIENDNIEFKRELNDKLEMEVVAFLNSNGGHIYIGIEDDGAVFGVDDVDDVQLQIKDRIRSRIAPSPIGFFEIVVDIKEDKNVIHIIIASGNEKPYYIKKYGMCPLGSYIRVGNGCVQLTEKQIFNLYSKRTRTSLMNIISPQQDLTFTQLRIYYEEKGYEFTDNTYKQLNFLLNNDEFNYLAYLLSDQNSLVINVGKFKGSDVFDLKELHSYSNQSLIKTTFEILDYIENQNITYTEIKSPTRVEHKLFNSIAMREAIINAIVHNDYSYENMPTIRLFEDHIEIISVGGLPEGIEKEEFLNSYISPKNPQLMKIFRDLALVEHMGTGIFRILSVYDKSIYTFTPNFIKVSIPFDRLNNIEKNVNKSKRLTGRQEKILSFIESYEKYTQQEIANELNISRSTVVREINYLIKLGIISK